MDLRVALGKNEFELFYQPLINLAEGKVIGFEALLRWRSPERGLVPPNDFIPLAEEVGLIASIGAWVLRRPARCRDLAGPHQGRRQSLAGPVQERALVLDVARRSRSPDCRRTGSSWRSPRP
jgi:EAL domain-containing protein (putative c-di-GMP-specific phosphodiesterase class I)